MEIALKPWLRWQMLRGKNNGRPKKTAKPNEHNCEK
jgi:hypothetical protein